MPVHDLKALLVVRLGSMGDVIHAMPAVAALRKTLPNATVGWVIEERWSELLCAPSVAFSGAVSAQRPLADHVHVVNTFKWRSSLFSGQTRKEVKERKRELRAGQYDAVVDFQGALKSSMIARWAKAPAIYGFSHPREKIARRFYSQAIEVSGAHIIEQNLSLAESVTGQRLPMIQPALPRDPAAESKMQQWLHDRKISNFVLINPGAGWGAKQWPAERYGQVAKQLASDGLSCLVNFGPKEDTLAQAVVQASAGAAQPIDCSITNLIALTRRASLFLGGDTGPMHLAAALAVPVVAIFGPTDPGRNGPFGTRNLVLRNAASITSYSHHGRVDEGLIKISSGEVVDAARELLRSNQ
jgi:heptosyltransferase-1